VHSASQEHVQGVCVSDVNGLCMGASGSLLPASSAFIQSLLLHAISLSDEGEHPLLLLHSTRADTLIHHADGYTTAIARTSTAAGAGDELQAAAAALQAGGHERSMSGDAADQLGD
jgi:hypothetical protein